MPVPAGAAVDPDSALHAYAQARLADGDGALQAAVANYRAAMTLDPDSVAIARRSFAQALESGDHALAVRAATMLDAEGILPRDGTLLLIGEALEKRDWAAAARATDRLEQEGNFAFLAPMVRSWIAQGEGRTAPAVISDADPFANLARRYVDEHVALQAIARGDLETAMPAARRALALRGGSDGAALRLTFAGQLAARGFRDEALTMLPDGSADFAAARSDLKRGKYPKGKRAMLSPAQGYARLVSRLAADIATDEAGVALGMRLARIATFADPASAEGHIIAARLLTAAGYPAFGVAEARKAAEDKWYGPLGEAELIVALAEAGDRADAISLARSRAEQAGADAARHVQLGRLLADEKDFAGAAAAFRAAQAGYTDENMPWSLLLFEGSALEQGEQWDAALAVLERAAKLAPNEPVILNYLGYAQIERRRNVDQALALLQRASALKPQDPSITDSLGWAQYVTGNVKAAVPVLERAAAGAPDDPTVNEHLGDALWSAGRRYEARYAWNAAAIFAEGDVAERLAAKSREGLKPEYAAP
ncbi:tetratricopeptide repeat protein [Sphingobium abikonense]|uniref:tetratricopeptide repeat protein n=1 Tax=Sphingobium abikonense TaxID=86193 RepID=UPI0035188629